MKALVLSLALVAASAAGAVTVPNGDFSAGNSGFTSDYTFGPAVTGSQYYDVQTNAQTSHPSYVSFGDHTTGTGLYLIANGAEVADATVYRSASIAVLAGTTYSFGAFLANAYPGNPAAIDFRVALGAGPATSIGSFTIPAGSGVWNSAAQPFFTGAATSVLLSFVDLNLAAGGNDFAIDDITLTQVSAAVPEPAMWSMMIAGFGLVGAVLRRRATVAA
ncbi:MAG: PEP-CTERM sorting domain-containing protein [Sphingomonadaceae bacterium]|nr:PEP-CTERM sorting domain-containing protein [Sphingomonadaceae bacterium]